MQPTTPSPPARIGLVGTGPWAVGVHGAAMAATAGVEAAAVWGRDQERTESAAARLGIPAAGSFEELLSACDGLVFAVPPDVQADLAAKALEAGRRVLLEKPVAFDPAAAARVLDAATGSGVRGLVFYTHLWVARTADWLVSLRDEGGWDRARIEMITGVMRTDNPFSASPWRRVRGGLWDLGPHALSVLDVVMGPVERVTATVSRGTAHLVLDHAAGTLSTVTVSLDARVPDRYEYLFEGVRVEAPVPTGSPTLEAAREAAGAALSGLVATEPPPLAAHVGMQAGARAVAILDAAGRSAAAGRSVDI